MSLYETGNLIVEKNYSSEAKKMCLEDADFSYIEMADEHFGTRRGRSRMGTSASACQMERERDKETEREREREGNGRKVTNNRAEFSSTL